MGSLCNVNTKSIFAGTPEHRTNEEVLNAAGELFVVKLGKLQYYQYRNITWKDGDRRSVEDHLLAELNTE